MLHDLWTFMSCSLASANVCNDTLNPAQQRHDVLRLIHLVLVGRERKGGLVHNAKRQPENHRNDEHHDNLQGGNQCKASLSQAKRSRCQSCSS